MFLFCISELYIMFGDFCWKFNFVDIFEVIFGVFININKLVCEDQQLLVFFFCIYNFFIEYCFMEIYFIDCYLFGLEGKRWEVCIFCYYWFFNWE